VKMKNILKVCALLAIFVLLTAVVDAQTANDSTQRFEKAGVAFDFPSGWQATDSSTEGVLHVTVAPPSADLQVSVISQLAIGEQCDFKAASKIITDALIERAAKQIQAAPERLPIKTQVGAIEVEGVQLRALTNGVPVSSEIYSVRVGLRQVNLVYTHVDGDAKGQSAWELVRRTLKLPAPVVADKAVSPGETRGPGILNGRALRLGRPVYPLSAKSAHATGTVVVQVTIDETGKVVAAAAMAGHPLLRGSAVAAARGSIFAPTKLCGEAVRVSGYITYNFTTQ
jgi:TonB family protein